MAFTQNQIGIYPIGGGGGGFAPQELVDTQFLTSSANWDGATAVSAGATFVDIILIGGGGGGASGERDTGFTDEGGGFGGAAGKITYIKQIPIGFLSLTESFVSGAGGSGGAAVTTDDTLGFSGNPGVSSTFYDYKGEGGLGGNSSSAVSNVVGEGSIVFPGFFSESNIIVIDSYPGTSGGNNLMFSAGGGGGGIMSGGISTPGASSSIDCSYRDVASVTSAGGTVGAGENGKVYFTYYATGGGGGGTNNAGSVGFAGGNGLQGSGGGGGSPAANGTTSGAGGDGGDGVLVVFAYK